MVWTTPLKRVLLGIVASLPALCLSSFFAACGNKVQKTTSVEPGVFVKPVIRVGNGRELHLSGTLAAERSIALSFATLGTVEQVMVEEGQEVKKGDVLAKLVSRSYEDALAMAEANLNQAEDAYRRLEPMHRNGTLADVKMVEVETARQQARLAASIARKNLDDTSLRSPVNGVIADRNVEPGASASPVLPAFTLVQAKTLLATAPVPETQVSKIRRGMSARVVIPALHKTVEGSVREISVVANPLTRTYDLKVAVANPTGELRLGMIADVYIKVDGEVENLVIPPEAIRVDEVGNPYVYVVAADRRLQRRPVRVGGFVGEGTMVTAGVRAGESLVVSGTPMLADGMTVRVLAPHANGE